MREAAYRQRAARVLGVGVDTVVRRALRGLFARGARRSPVPSATELERGFALLRCFDTQEVRRDPDLLMGPPESLPYFRPVARREVAGGTEIHYVFPTPYAPVQPAYRDEYARHEAIHQAHLYGWVHHAPAPGSLLLVHGWGLGTKRMAMLEYGVEHFFGRLGLDVYFYVLPFHGLRKPSGTRFSGELFPSANLLRTNEGFVQTVRELRTAIGFIERRNPAPLGMMGSSLGGYTTALLASLDDRIAFAVPVLAPASMAELLWEHGRDDPMRKAAEELGMTQERFASAWAVHSPLRYTPKVPFEARMLVSATGDSLVPPRFIDPLWRHWGEPAHVRFAGGHILQVFRAHYHREVGRMLRRLGITRTASG